MIHRTGRTLTGLVAGMLVVGITLTLQRVWVPRTSHVPGSTVVGRSLDAAGTRAHGSSRNDVRITVGAEHFRIGESAAGEAREFGWIQDGAFLRDGAVVISDFIKDRLVWISADGRSLSLVGRHGSGPGEFGEPTSMYRGGDTLFVLDNALRRLTAYTGVAGGLAPAGSARSLSEGYTACAWSSGYLALEYSPQHESIFTTYSKAGATAHFGLPLRAASHRLNRQLTKGRLVCERNARRAYLAAMTGDIVAYAPDGSLRWHTRLQAFVPADVREVGEGLISVGLARAPARFTNTVAGFVALDDSLAIVQLKVLVPNTTGSVVRDRLVAIDTRVIDLRTGGEVGRQDDLPQVLAVQAGFLLTTGEDPEPWVAVQRYNLSGVAAERISAGRSPTHESISRLPSRGVRRSEP